MVCERIHVVCETPERPETSAAKRPAMPNKFMPPSAENRYALPSRPLEDPMWFKLQNTTYRKPLPLHSCGTQAQTANVMRVKHKRNCFGNLPDCSEWKAEPTLPGVL